MPDDLLFELEQLPQAAWEGAYARRSRPLTKDEVFQALQADRPYANWLAFRFDAGLPGIPLPKFEDAVRAVMAGQQGGQLAAFAVVFHEHGLPVGSSPNEILALLVNSAISALGGKLNWFSTWLATRACLAALALGRPETTWGLYGAMLGGKLYDPRLDKLEYFVPIRGHQLLENSPWVRATIARLWPDLGVLVIRSLPVASPDAADRPSADEVARECEFVEAKLLAELVRETGRMVDRTELEAREQDLVVASLRADLETIPDLIAGELPNWYRNWAAAVFRQHDLALARAAGRLLFRHHPERAVESAILVFRKAKACDLPLLQAGFQQAEMQSLFDELKSALPQVSAQISDALVATALPHHADFEAGVDVLEANLPALSVLRPVPGGVVEHLIASARKCAGK